MKASILLFLITIINFSVVYGQDSYQQGYFIKNNGEKINCLIKNMDWENNPTSFNYKLSESSPKETTTIEQVQEFEITNFAKYQRFKVKVDTSGSEYRYLSDNQAPDYKEMTLFLKLLVSGKANLYFYHKVNMNRFFIQVDSLPIEQLIYKKYSDKDDLIKSNNLYKNQLINYLKCEKISGQEFIRTEYNTKSLTNIFLKYNSCFGQESINYVSKPKRDVFNIGARIGVNQANLNIRAGSNANSPLNTDFEKLVTPRMGLDVELILPFRNNRWAIVFEPNFQYHRIKHIFNNVFPNRGEIVDFRYTAIEIPTGVRHYIFLNPKLKAFINASVVFDIPILNSRMEYQGTRKDIVIVTSNGFAIGGGMNFMKKYIIEMKYYTPRNLTGKHASIQSNYQLLSFAVGYNFLRNSKK